MFGERHPEVAATILRAVDDNKGFHSIEAINFCTCRLEEAGFVAPSWVQFVSGDVQDLDVVDEEEPNQPRRGGKQPCHTWKRSFGMGCSPHSRIGTS